MSYTVRLRRYNGSSWETAYTFPINPFLSPLAVNEHNDAEPPRITATRWTWALEALLDGAGEEAVHDKWTELREAIEGEPPVQGVQLLRDGVVVEDISPEGGYQQVKVEQLSSPKTDTQWTTDVTVQMRVTGYKRIANPSAPDPDSGEVGGEDGETDPVGALEQTLSYDYDPNGLATKTLSGVVETVTGVSAEALARAFTLPLPGSEWAYVTRGPEGVNVEVLDQANTRARFTSVIRQSGAPLPAGVGPDFKAIVETTTADGKETTKTTVTAVGPSALAAVRSKRPAGKVFEQITSDPHGRAAQAVYIQEAKAPNAPPVRRHRFVITGGGRPIRWTRRAGGREPAKHIGSATEVLIEEECTVERYGRPAGIQDFKFPSPLSNVDQDTSRTRHEAPEREIGKDESADKWIATIHRFYTAARFYPAYLEILKSVVAPGQASNLDLEAQRQDKDLPNG